MHRSIFTLATAAFMLVACDSSPTGLAPAPTVPSLARGGTPGPNDGHPAHQHTRSPFAWYVRNACIPEEIWVEGFTQYNAHFKFIDGGNDSRLLRITVASGVGIVTGANYRFHEKWTLQGRYTIAGNHWDTEQTTRYHVISEGPLPNFMMTMKTKVVHSNGTVTTEVISVDSDCRG